MSETEIAAPAEAGPDARVFEGQAEQEQPRALVAVVSAARYLVWGLAPLFLASIVYTIFQAIFQHRTPTPFNGWIGVFVVFAAIVAALRALARGQGDPRRSPVRLRADAEGLSCDGVLVAWRGSILRGTAARLPRGGARASIVARTPMGFEEDLRFLVRTEEDGRRLVEACGVGPMQRSFSFRAAPSVASVVWPFVIASGMLCATVVSAAAGVWTAAPVIPFLVVLAIIAILAIGLEYARTQVVIGVDGVKLVPDAAERVRVAAAACASPQVRVCLESIAEDENEREVAGRLAALRE